MTTVHARHDELCYLSAVDVAALCGSIDPVAVVTEAFRAVRVGAAGIAPEAALRWTAPDGSAARSLVLPAWRTGTYGCKIINACVGNVERGLPRAHGLIVLHDRDTAAPVCVMEAGRISALRTAAVSVAALRAVRRLEDVRDVAFLGCGRQARTHLELLAPAGGLSTVTVHDVDPRRGEAFAAEVSATWPGVTATHVDTPEAAVRAAEVTIAATTTTTPYVPLDWLPPGAVFVNVSLDDAGEDLLLGCDHLLVDDWPLVSEDDTRLLGRLARAGRVSGPGERPPPGGRAVDADLPTLLVGAYERRVTPTDRVVVNPFGMGVHDIAIATEVYAAAIRSGVGNRLPR
jgi:ornithine cyclodeaminase/alanine dehydrogenase-like protein (mu-crystallin family)